MMIKSEKNLKIKKKLEFITDIFEGESKVSSSFLSLLLFRTTHTSVTDNIVCCIKKNFILQNEQNSERPNFEVAKNQIVFR